MLIIVQIHYALHRCETLETSIIRLWVCERHPTVWQCRHCIRAGECCIRMPRPMIRMAFCFRGDIDTLSRPSAPPHNRLSHFAHIRMVLMINLCLRMDFKTFRNSSATVNLSNSGPIPWASCHFRTLITPVIRCNSNSCRVGDLPRSPPFLHPSTGTNIN